MRNPGITRAGMKTMQQSDACLNHMLALNCELYPTETVQDAGEKFLYCQGLGKWES